MKNIYIFFIFFFIYFLNIVRCDDNGLTLYVNPNSNNNNNECGSSIQNPCVSLGSAFKSYALQTGGSNTTTLSLQLLDGEYPATVGNSILQNNININTLNIYSYSNNSANVVLSGSNINYPFFNYLQTTKQSLLLSVYNVSFVNSSSIVNSTSTLSATFYNCVFRDFSSGDNSLFTFSNPNTTWTPTVAFLNSQFRNINCGTKQMTKTQATTFLLNNVTLTNSISSIGFYFTGSGLISNVTAVGNTASVSLFGFTIDDNVSIMDSVFDSNYGTPLTFFDQDTFTVMIENSNFTNNKAPYNSGAISFGRNNGGSFKVTKSNFISNYALNAGAIFSTGNYLTLYSSTFYNNTADVSGGALYGGPSTTVLFSGCTITNNKAQNGGAIYAYSSTISLDSDTINSNQATNGNDVVCYSSSFGISSSSLVNSNYLCPNNDCKFTNPSNFQCPTGGPSSTTTSSTGTITTSSTSSTSSISTSSTSGSPLHPDGLDKSEKIGIAVGVSIAGLFAILICVCVIYRYNSARVYASQYCGTNHITSTPIATTITPTISSSHHHHHHGHHHGHHHHHGNHNHHHINHHNHHHHHHGHSESSPLIDNSHHHHHGHH